MTASGREMIRWGKLLFERRLISGWGGNLSCRIGRKGFLITGQHAPLGFLTANKLVRLNQDGKPLIANQQASSETPMHLAIYQGSDAQAIIHAHPPTVLAFSVVHESFVPLSFEEKYTIGEVPIIPQDTPTVTQPVPVVEALKYHPVIILKGHGTVAIGKDFQEAFLLTDLLQEAVRCQLLNERISPAHGLAARNVERSGQADAMSRSNEKSFVLFSQHHMTALVESANNDCQFQTHGNESDLTTSLTLHLEETDESWTVNFVRGKITVLEIGDGGEFMISGKKEWWKAVFGNRIDPFLATQQGKLKLKRGELSQLSRWYKPFQRAFSLWQSIPVR